MKCFRNPALAAFLILSVASAYAADAEQERDRIRISTSMRTSPHDKQYRLPQVTSIAFSPDGKRLVASYYVQAFNRPGTDWSAWTAQWDLKTGKRLVVPAACGPVAFSPDGQTVAMNIYDRKGMSPQTRFALWTVGAEKPHCLLKMPEGDNRSVISTVFHPDGKCLLAITGDGKVLIWHLDKDDPPKVIENVELKPMGRWQGGLGGPTMTFSGRHELMVGFGPSQSMISWHFNPDSGYLDRKSTSGLHLWRHDQREVFDVAFSPKQGMAAFSGRGKVSVSRNNGESLGQFPAGGGAVAFSPDGKLLAAGDNRGIIRIWDIAGGSLVRTLRLDDRPANTVLVAAIQCYSKFGDPEGNRKKLTDLIRRAAFRGAKIVVLPETAVTGYLSADLKKTWRVENRPINDGLVGVEPADAAETVPGPSTKIFGKLADECGIYLTVPLLEVDRKTGRYYNTSVLLGPDGRILIHYRKRDPWQWAERGWATRGDRGNPVVDTPFGRLGLLICYDIHDQAKIMSQLKIDTLLYSIAWVEDEGSDWFEKKLPVIAGSNSFNVVASNWTVPKDADPKWHGYGQSRIIDASGKVLAKSANDLHDEIIYAELPLPAQSQGEKVQQATTKK